MTERPLRVCVLLGGYPPDVAGHGVQMSRTFPRLRERGVEAEVLTRRSGRAIEGGTAEAVRVHRILPRGRGALTKLRSARAMRRWLRENGRRFDVLHATLTGWDFFLNAALPARLGLPLLMEVVLLGSDDPASQSTRRLGRFRLRQLRRVDAWAGISRTFLPTLRAVGIPEERFRLIYTGVDCARYRPREPEERRALRERLGLPVDGRVALTVGAVKPRKGMDRVLAAWRRLRPRAGRDCLIVAGTTEVRADERPFCEALLREAREPELRDTVRFVGMADNVDELMGAADAFLLLSRREGLGTVTLEALASGLPCLVSPLDGIADEILEDGRTGFVVRSPDDAEATADLLSKVLEDEALRLSVGRAGREAATRRFSLEERAAALAALYRELAHEGRPA